MPPATSPGSRASRVRFRRAITLMLMTLVLPGSAQLVAGNRRIGRIALRIWGGLLASALLVLLLSLVWRTAAFWLVSDIAALGLLQTVLMMVAVGWAGLFVDAWRLGQPLTLRQNQRLAVVGVNGLLCFTVAGTLLFGAHLVSVQRDFMATMFGDGVASGAHEGRYNVLLMGGDSGQGRWGLRPDSITVASIDAESGRTVLFGLPRNLTDFPFEDGSVMAGQFPDGFDCDGCYLNAVTTWARDHAGLFEGVEDPGTEATISAVEGVTGLQVNYWAMVNLEGFKDLVDAVGGVTLNVREPIPVLGREHEVIDHIEPGFRELNGYETLWFARSRTGSDDYSRMARQKCVMAAMLHQLDPQQAVKNFERITEVGTAMVSTDLPRSEVPEFIDLALKAKNHPLSTVSFVPPMINTGDPDIELIHAKVEQAIERATPGDEHGDDDPKGDKKSDTAGTPPRGGSGPPTTTGGSIGSLSEGYAANQAQNLGAVC